MHPNCQDRQCTCSDTARMKAVSKTWDRYNSVIRYQCNTCDNSVEIIPLSHIGYTLTVGVLALLFIIYIFVIKTHDAGFWTYTIVGSLIVYQLFTTTAHCLAHHLHPLALKPKAPVFQVRKTNLRTRIEGMSFLSGVFLPIILGGFILGVALMLGVLHDLYFPRP
ncbi:hypothetical protein EBB79_13140 [Parasedimentitalea marina]|uniref:Uncharacterized protein n=1 Tax=Parasedimentitalea marina TaxID=2483033 RepID=A0A3T0N3W0_9RHOB|nr:hypothetical protein EBB79_13140 [Parasedimentitalea marina]